MAALRRAAARPALAGACREWKGRGSGRAAARRAEAAGQGWPERARRRRARPAHPAAPAAQARASHWLVRRGQSSARPGQQQGHWLTQAGQRLAPKGGRRAVLGWLPGGPARAGQAQNRRRGPTRQGQRPKSAGVWESESVWWSSLGRSLRHSAMGTKPGRLSFGERPLYYGGRNGETRQCGRK